MAQGRTVRTPEKGERLLRKLELGYSVSAACRAEGISRSTYYLWRTEDADFAKRADDAVEEGTDRLEDEARKRATAAAEPSDTLLIFLLKGRRPEKYRERHETKVVGHDGGPLTITGIEIPKPAEVAP